MLGCTKVRYRLYGEQVVKAFQSRHFEAVYVDTKEEALQEALDSITEGSVVAWGDSSTTKEIGLLDALRKGNYTLVDRDSCELSDRPEVDRKAFTSDYYFLSSNAISADGQLVNIDGAGNRVAAMIYGPKKVIVVAGMNKVVGSVEAARERAQNIAAPINKQRIPGDTPCRKTGSCMNCKSQGSICSQYVTTRLCYPAGRIKVILIGEDLGF